MALHPRRCPFLSSLVLLAGGCCLFSVLSAQSQPADRGLALVGGRLLTQTDAGVQEAALLIRDGKIAAIGGEIPAGAARIDVSGCTITPGLIDARSTLWLSAGAAREGAADGGLDVLDAVDPHQENWKDVVRQGVTAVYVQPGSQGLLGGKGAVLRVVPRGAPTVENLVVRSEAGAQAALGIQPSQQAASAAPAFPRRFGGDPPAAEPAETAPAAPQSGNALTRHGQYEQLKRALEGARESSSGGTPAAAAGGGSAGRSRRDPARDFLRKVLKGEVPLRLEAHREDDIQNALRLADELKLRLVLEGVSNPRSMAAGFASRRVPLVLGPFVELEEVPAHRRGRPASWPGSLLTPQTTWGLGTFSGQAGGSRLLRVHAAAAVARGLDPDQVLRAMTWGAASILGVSDRLGSIAPGKQADLAVFAGDPLDPSVPVRLVVADGKIAYESSPPPRPVAADSKAKPGDLAGLPARLPKTYYLRTGRLLLEDGKSQPGMIQVEGGKLAAAGPSLTAAEGAPVYDLGSAVVAPGLVAAHGPSALAAAVDDPVEADAGQVRAADAVDPQHRSLRELLEGGFTGTLIAPGGANVIAGMACGARLGTRDLVTGDTGMKFVLAASARTAGRGSADPTEIPAGPPFGARPRGPSRYPGSLAGQIELIEQVLGGRGPASELYVAAPVRERLQSERRRRVSELLERKQLAFFEAHHRAEIDATLRLVARFKLRGVLIGPGEIRPFLADMQKLGVGIVVSPAAVIEKDGYASQVAEAAAAGVPIAFGMGSAQELRLACALAVQAGMPRETAWLSLTTSARELAGLPENAGRLKVGGPADLVIWDGSPLNLCRRPLRVIIDGKLSGSQSHED